MRSLQCAAIVLALQLGCCLAHPSACASGHAEVCASLGADNAADDASLLQVKRHGGEQEQEFPNFGKEFSKAAGYVKDIAGKVADATSQASTAVSEGVATALTTLGDTLTRSFTVLASEAQVLQTRVNASKAAITNGIASAIALRKSVSTKTLKVPVNESYEEELNVTLLATTATWGAMDKSAEAAVNALAKGLEAAGLGDMATSFQSTMQVSLEKADAFVDSLHQVSLSLWDSDKEERAEEVIDKVNASLQVAAGYAEAFPADFLRSFVSLEEGVLNATSGLLNAEERDRVSASFGDAREQAKAAADGLGNASLELIEALDTGLSATRLAMQSGVAARHGVFALLLLSIALSLS